MESTTIAESKAFEQMDALDEKQISEELNGHILDEYFYTVNGKWGLSYAGVKAVALAYAKSGHPLSIIHCEVIPSPDGTAWLATAIGEDLTTKEKRVGHAEVERFLDAAGTKKRPFAYTIAGTKAQRNALRHFLPETVIQNARAEFEKPRKDVTGESKVRSFVGGKEVK